MSTQNTATATEEKELTPYQMKRRKLRDLSAAAKMMQAEGMKCEGMTINEILIDEFYSDSENVEFYTLLEWNRQGMSVKKGESAFVVWGRPKAKQESQEQQPEAIEDEDNDFYPLCYLFSNAQVQPKATR